MITSNMYSVNDKAIYDALNQNKVTNSDLVNLFLSRGVVISRNSSREELANMFSRMFHDFSDYDKLASIFSIASRREKNTFSYIEADKIEERVVIDVLKEINSHIFDIDQAEARFIKDGQILRLSLEYKDVNFNKSEFRQVVDKDADIEIEKVLDEESGSFVYSIRHPLNKTCERVVDRVIERINLSISDVNDHIIPQELSLTGYEDAEVRSNFFLELIKKIDKTELHDVTYVYVYQPKVESDWMEDEDDETSEDESDNMVGTKKLEGVHISKAYLNGVGVAYSEELLSLQKKGFYIWKVVWKVKEIGFDSDIYELEAQFSDPERFSKFSYMVRGEYRYLESGKYSQNSIKCSSQDEKKFSKRIELAAKKIIRDIEETHNKQGDENETESSVD
tara:strand:- start:2172 stop:3350 length:1179 start_codon:yes stop_codon:yes gene_type:complete